MPASTLAKVDLPEPFSPSSACTSPPYRSRLAPWSASVGPKDLARSIADKAGTACPVITSSRFAQIRTKLLLQIRWRPALRRQIAKIDIVFPDILRGDCDARHHRHREGHDPRDHVGQRIAIEQAHRVLYRGAAIDDRRLADDHRHGPVLDQIERAAGEAAGQDLGLRVHALDLLRRTHAEDAGDGIEIIGVGIFEQHVGGLLLTILDADLALEGVTDQLETALPRPRLHALEPDLVPLRTRRTRKRDHLGFGFLLAGVISQRLPDLMLVLENPQRHFW